MYTGCFLPIYLGLKFGPIPNGFEAFSPKIHLLHVQYHNVTWSTLLNVQVTGCQVTFGVKYIGIFPSITYENLAEKNGQKCRK